MTTGADDRPPSAAPPLVEVDRLHKHYAAGHGFRSAGQHATRAVDGVSFDIRGGETLGLVGESGCGKTTLGKLVLRLVPATAGDVRFRGKSVFGLGAGELRAMRRRMQIIYQDPYSSLDPRMRIGDIVGEGPLIHGMRSRAERDARVRELLELVGLGAAHLDQYPHEFSGGQRQRIGIARALALDPEFIVCDEPVSALDVSIQSQVLNLLTDLQSRLHLTYLFISHNLAAVRHISDRVAVMYLGRLVELADADALFGAARHPYTVALLSAVPQPDPHRRRRRIVLRGDVPSPTAVPTGCRFHTRCWLREQLGDPEECVTTDPPLRDVGGGHLAACLFADRITDDVVARVSASAEGAALQARESRPVNRP